MPSKIQFSHAHCQGKRTLKYQSGSTTSSTASVGLRFAPFPHAPRRAAGTRLDRVPRQPALQVFGHGERRGVAVLRRLFQALQADRLQVAVDAQVHGPRPRRIAVEHLQDRFQFGFGAERRPAGQQLVEDGAQPVHVHRRGQRFFRARLLRRQVARRADDGARARFQATAIGAAAIDAPGQPEVGNVRLAPGIEQDVARLEVAVEDAVLMGVMDRPRHLGQQRDRGLRVSDKLRRAPRQADAVDQLHAEVVLPFVFTDFIDRHNVRVVEIGRRFRLAMKPFDVGVAGQVAGEDHLQRNDAVETGLSSFVDHPHAAAGDLFEQFVVADVADPVAGARLAGIAPRFGVGRVDLGRWRQCGGVG
ncbi:MAG: hypothetical protein L0Y71_06440 [Gemmataceae bacterium]|nr:hypothetical protein [Gemmataceae bacterium]